jgi:hypothetical protein
MTEPAKRRFASPSLRLSLGLLAGYLLASLGWMVGGAWFLVLSITLLAGFAWSTRRWQAGKWFLLGAFIMSLVGAGLYALAFYSGGPP